MFLTKCTVSFPTQYSVLADITHTHTHTHRAYRCLLTYNWYKCHHGLAPRHLTRCCSQLRNSALQKQTSSSFRGHTHRLASGLLVLLTQRHEMICQCLWRAANDHSTTCNIRWKLFFFRRSQYECMISLCASCGSIFLLCVRSLLLL